MSDNRKQYADTTDAQSKKIIELLKKYKSLGADVSTIWENIDGCAEYYRCATDLCLLPI